MTDKTCSRCKTNKSVTEFNRSKVNQDGLHSWCRMCTSAWSRERSAEQKMRKALYMETYNAKYNEEQYVLKWAATYRQRANQHGCTYVEDVDRRTVWALDGMHCCGCRNFILLEDMHLDHIVPFSRGGEHSYANVQTLCSSCNKRKLNRTNAEMGWSPRGELGQHRWTSVIKSTWSVPKSFGS